jgi:CysZ protein
MQSYFTAHAFIREHRLLHWVIWPGIVYCLMFGIGLYYIWVFSDFFTMSISAYFGLERWIQELQSGWISLLFILLALAVRLVFLIYYFAVFKYIFLIIGSPVFAYLSQKTVAILDRKEFLLEMPRYRKEIARGIRLSVRNFLWQTLLTLVLFLLSFIPVIGWATPLAALVSECYFLGFSMMDYSNEQRILPVKDSVRLIREHRGLAVGNGLVFYLLHIVLVAGWIIAPSYAVIAATLQSYQSKRI